MKNRFKLLIVDDDLSDQMLIQKAIEKAGFNVEVTTARSGEEGLQKVSALNPEAIVVLDHSLPGMDGFEVCKKIKAVDDHLKVIICTGAINSVGEDQAKNAKADDYCLKTSDYQALVNAIHNLLQVK